jgi:hypothetical protein
MRRLIAALSAAALAATTATIVVGSGTAATAADEPAFTLQTKDRVVVWKRRGSDDVAVDLGLYLEGGSSDFEVRSHRPDWDEKIVTTWTAGDLGGTFPQGTQRSFRRLHRFLVIDYRRLDGTLVHRSSVSPCLNQWQSQRTSPDAEPRNKYPYGCPWADFTVGSVQGVQAGWATRLPSWKRLGVTRGRYDVTVRVAKKWADALGMTAADAVTTRLVVRRRTADDGHDHTHRALRPTAQRRQPSAEATVVPRPAATEPTTPSAGAVAGPRPDLQSLPAFDIGLNRKRTVLRFSANVWNAGDSPLVVDGFRRDGEDVMDAYQYYFDTDGNQVGYDLVGEMKYHRANHQHWHFQDFARYRLLAADGSQVARSRKVSFCLANTDAVDYTVPGADWHPENTDLSTACGEDDSLSVREVLSAGSGDTYSQYRAGQAFRIKDLPKGRYWISVEANPRNVLVEHDTANNDSRRRVWIGGKPGGERRIRVPQVGIIEE